MKDKITVPEYFKAWCTDRDEEVECAFISSSHDSIRASLQGVPLVFKRYKPGVYVANFSGMEFVYKI